VGHTTDPANRCPPVAAPHQQPEPRRPGRIHARRPGRRRDGHRRLRREDRESEIHPGAGDRAAVVGWPCPSPSPATTATDRQGPAAV